MLIPTVSKKNSSICCIMPNNSPQRHFTWSLYLLSNPIDFPVSQVAMILTCAPALSGRKEFNQDRRQQLQKKWMASNFQRHQHTKNVGQQPKNKLPNMIVMMVLSIRSSFIYLVSHGSLFFTSTQFSIWGAVKIYYNCLACFWRVIVFGGGHIVLQGFAVLGTILHVHKS